jgi:hypothetical protein
MKEPYGKGLATRPDPESCAGHGNMAGEALTGAHAREEKVTATKSGEYRKHRVCGQPKGSASQRGQNAFLRTGVRAGGSLRSAGAHSGFYTPVATASPLPSDGAP